MDHEPIRKIKFNSTRKQAGFFLFLFSFVFLYLSYVTLSRAELSEECQSKLTQELVELIQKDHHQILEKQLKLTTLKLAAATKKSRAITVEKLIQQETARVDEQDKNQIREKLIALYQANGQAKDAQTAAVLVEPVMNKYQSGSYWKKELRFKNADLSSFVLAHSLAFPDESPFMPEDAAILWMQSQLSEATTRRYGRGSAKANLQEVSTRVARLTGAIQGAAHLTVEELEKKVDEAEDEVFEHLNQLMNRFTTEAKMACLMNKSSDSCGPSEISDVEKYDLFQASISKITDQLEKDQESLNQKIVQDAGAEIRRKQIEVRVDGISETRSSSGAESQEEIQKVAKRIAENGPFMDAVSKIAQKAPQAPSAASLLMGFCSATVEKETRSDGKSRALITLDPNSPQEKKNTRSEIQVWVPAVSAPAESTAVALKGLNQAQTLPLARELHDGPCFKPAP